MSDKKSTPKKVSKSKNSQAKNLLTFAAATVAAGSAVAKKATKGKSKGQSTLIKTLIFVVCAVVLICGGLYYYDIAPFDFSIDGGDIFKFYTYENYEYEVKKPNNAVVAAPKSTLKVHFIDVGQGDCVFIQFPDNKTMLIDGGKNSSSVANGIINYLTSLHPDEEKITIDYVMLTHCDSDHCGSLDDVIASDKIDVKCVYQPMVYSSYEQDPLKDKNPNGDYATISTSVYKNFVKAVHEEKTAGILDEIIYNKQGLVIEGQGWQIKLYNPDISMYKSLNTAEAKNNISPIMVLYFGDIKILFTGDADDAAEKNFIKNVMADLFGDGFDGDVDVLKVAHHGGEDSTSMEFLNLVKPQYSIISVAEKNSYGHPRQATLDRLKKIGSEVLRTDIKGTIVLCSTGSDITFLYGNNDASAMLLKFDMSRNIDIALHGGYLR
jgi:competence protein ComEC